MNKEAIYQVFCNKLFYKFKVKENKLPAVKDLEAHQDPVVPEALLHLHCHPRHPRVNPEGQEALEAPAGLEDQEGLRDQPDLRVLAGQAALILSLNHKK